MGGLLDFLFSGQGGQGGGLLGGMYGQQGGQQMGPDGMPMQISPGPQQQGLNVPNMAPQGMPQQNPGMQPTQNPGMMPQGAPPQPPAPSMAGGLNPAFFASQVDQGQNQRGGLMGALFGQQPNGIMDSMHRSLSGIADPQGQKQQQAIQNYLAVKAAEEKPQYIPIDDPATGMKRLVQIQPFGRGASWLNPSEPGTAGGGSPPKPPPGLPPGADVKTYREKTATAAAANEEDAVKSAKAAADLQPHLNEMHDAYEAAIKAGAIGPVAGSTVARANDKYNPLVRYGVVGNPDAEAARQRYEIAKSAVQARITAAQNKGEGSVSNYERSLYAAQFPELTAIDPQTQIKTLRQLRDQGQQTIAAGKIPSIGQAPQVGAVLNRPAVGSVQAPQGAPPPAGAPPPPSGPAIAPPSAPIRVTSKSQFDMLPSGSPFIAPDGSTRRKP